MNRSGFRRWIGVGAMVACSGLAALLVAELLLRVANDQAVLAQLDPRVEHRYAPLRQAEGRWGPLRYPLYTNSLGWRDRQPGRRVEPRTRAGSRIVFLGDSFTEGLGYRQEETVSGFADSLLRRSGAGVEVLNGGMTSYCPLLEYQRLKGFLEAGYRTDTVVLLPDFSDAWDELRYRQRCTFDARGEPFGFATGLHSPRVRFLINHSALFERLCHTRLGGLFQPGHTQGTPNDEESWRRLRGRGGRLEFAILESLSAKANQALHSAWTGHAPSLQGWVPEGLHCLREDLRRIRRLCDTHRIRLLVVLYPWPSQLEATASAAQLAELRRLSPQLVALRERILDGRRLSTPDAYQRTVRELCATEGVELIDLVADFASTPDWPELYIPGDVHFSARGNRLVGEAIAHRLRKRGLGGSTQPAPQTSG